ncbi:TetR family transcriptional regulator [Azoarcus sp. CIB]|uniref:TetR/AcrR family transcriptional regulator n=1 Tax=Aromatoleum sp. (strain CIB) TaxID=198107 RepID=UPI00067D3AE1|nr:TetR/AcrR family transcriptional regulator [Azoarcus sp. CIB]AKU12741.1 TetR family transcriptional regulator [Azoarcus sp. CIB]
MKTKTEAKRQAILDEAAQAFRELGFEGASMSEICARVGGSKATLYNYFASKDELFFEVMTHSCEAEFEAAHLSIDPNTDDIRESLRHFGERFLGFLYSPEVLANRHLSIAESGRTKLGHLMYERGVLRSQRLIADFLQAAMAQGKLHRADPMLATKHFYALLESELIDGFLFQLPGSVGEEEIRGVTARALDVFMAAYGPCERGV